jgi:DNA polymerase iota
LISEAKRLVPDVVIVLGEELGRFRDASKSNYKFLESFTWSGKVERLGFDEVFMDVTDIVDYNLALLNPNDLTHSFFQLKQDDPTIGFEFNASCISGYAQPPPSASVISHTDDLLTTRLILGSHFAQRLRLSLEEEQGYTSTVGISTNKLLSKLVGNLNKPRAQTILMPPYTTEEGLGPDGDSENSNESNVIAFIDGHDIGKIPGIGFKMAHRLRNHVLSRPAEFDDGLIWGETKESVTVRDVRLFPGIGPQVLENILGGPGMERGVGGKVWGLINGVDDTEVQQMRKVPSQISIEDSYIRLDTLPQVLKELRMLATSLITRMHTDLLEHDDDHDSRSSKRWIAHPKTVRLSTRPRPPVNADGTRTRGFNRMSKSGPLPNFVFSLKDGIDVIVEKLVQTTLIPMFRQLHPQQGGWNLSLMNIGVTNMVEAASESSGGKGRDISKMFKRQVDVLKEWKVEDRDVPPDPPKEKIEASRTESRIESPDANQAEPSAGNEATDHIMVGSEDVLYPTQNTVDGNAEWEDEEDEDDNWEVCRECGALMPAFALPAHERFHSLKE